MEERFLSFVDKSDIKGCWNWIGCISASGYGRFNVDGKIYFSHRIAYELWVGKIPDGLIVRHKCKQNRRCVNPEHLETGTKDDNAKDRKRDGTEILGSDRATSKLTEEDVRQIRKLYEEGNITHRQLATQFNVNNSTIHFIIHKILWKHIN